MNSTTGIILLETAMAATGSTLRFGAGVPANTLGADGDSYLDTTGGIFYLRAAGAYTDQYTDQLGVGGTGLTQGQVDARVGALGLLKAQNLADLSNVATALTNLGINLGIVRTGRRGHVHRGRSGHCTHSGRRICDKGIRGWAGESGAKPYKLLRS